MAMCGFNEKMLTALKNFFDGAVEFGIIDRSKKNMVSVEEQFQREFAELHEWVKHSKSVDDSSLQKMLEGIGLLVAGLFENDRKQGVENYERNHQQLVYFFHEIDEMFYGKFSGDKKNMSKLFSWANEQKVFNAGDR